MAPEYFLGIFNQLGLSDLDAKIYYYFLIHPNHTVSSSANHFGLHRREIYKCLDNLSEFDLIRRDKDYSRRLYVTPPTKLRSILKEKEVNLHKSMFILEQKLPSLLYELDEGNKADYVQTYKGEQQFNYLFYTFLDEVNEGQILYSFNEGDDLYRAVDLDYFQNLWVEKRIQKKIFAKLLLRADNSLIHTERINDKIKYRESRILQLPNNPNCSFMLVSDKLILWDTVLIQATAIKSPYLVKLFSSIFELYWQISEAD